MHGIKHIENFIPDSENLFVWMENNIDWDERMSARKTASFGIAYDYSQISYPFQKFIPPIDKIRLSIENELGFEPNNCLINFYPDGKSKIGFHSDNTDILAPNTGVAIVSIGEERILRFRKTNEKALKKDFILSSGSLFYMNDKIQEEWQHAIPKSSTLNGRISLTFRKLK